MYAAEEVSWLASGEECAAVDGRSEVAGRSAVESEEVISLEEVFVRDFGSEVRSALVGQNVNQDDLNIANEPSFPLSYGSPALVLPSSPEIGSCP